jgi:Fe-S cluster biogenesis protein NfuA
MKRADNLSLARLGQSQHREQEDLMDVTMESSAAYFGDAEPHWNLIATTIDSLRPAVQQDGGDLALVKIERDRVSVRLSGACTTCAFAGHTLGGVRRRLVEVLGFPVRVVPAA